MTNARLPYLMGGVLVAGFAALSIMSYNALRNDISRTSEIVYWSAIKDSTDKVVLASYLERYPSGMFAPQVKARIEDVNAGRVMMAGGGSIAQMQAALDEAKAKAQAEAEKIVADAKAQAAKQAEMAQAEAAKQAETAKAEAARIAEASKAEAQRIAEANKAEQAKIEQARADVAKQAEMAKAEAAKAAEMARAEQAKAEQARAEAARQAEVAKAEAARQAEIAKADAAAKAAEAAKVAAAASAATAAAAAAKTAQSQPAAKPAQTQTAARPAATAPAPAAAPLAVPAPGTSSLVIISSTADGFKKGDRVGTAQAIAVPSGTRVVLMDAQGKVMTVRGPFTGQLGTSEINAPTPRPTGAFRTVSDASSLLERLGDALRGGDEAPRKIGAFRGVGASGLGLGATPADPWAIDVTASGHWCVAADKAVTMTRGANTSFDSITIETKPSGAKMDVPWPAGQASLQWPASVPAKNGATYELRMGGTVTSVALHLLDQKGATPGQVALWMAEQGCQRQASAMIDSLERGLAGKLFDLEVAGDGRASAAYRVGEELKVSLRTSREAYVYCFYRDVQGEVTKIFPSQFERTAQVGSAQSIPSPAWDSPMQLTGPAG
ncbi:MAG: DUF4384 domain-containing protein, partial [Rhodospirillales bacterium]|nr:DUF4384 domain-containing protein [Rhodospirillales bacterium]